MYFCYKGIIEKNLKLQWIKVFHLVSASKNSNFFLSLPPEHFALY